MPLVVFKKFARFALAEDGSVKAKVVRSGIWVGVSNTVGTILGLARSVILARLLTPEIFGLMGLAGVAIRAIETFTRPGVAQALIARQRAFEEAAATAFTLLVARGLLLAVALAIVAPWVARFYEAAELGPMLQALSVVFILGGLSNINTIARQKELEFRQLSYLGLTTAVLGTVVTVSLAFWLRSVWALVFGQVASVAAGVMLSYRFVEGRLRFAWNREIAVELLLYGRFITGSSIVLFIALELDSAVIGKMLGVKELGFYALAFTIANLATTNLSKITSSIMMPAYSKLQFDPPALQRAFLRSFSMVIFAVLPATIGLILVAEPLIRLVYGAKWLPAVALLQVLAVFGLFRALASFSGYLFEGIGMPRIAFQLGLLRLAIIVPLIIPMIRYFGLLGAALTVTIGIAAQWLTGLFFLRKNIGVGVLDVAKCAWRSMWTTAAMGLAVFAAIVVLGADTLKAFIVTAGAGIGVYLALNWPVLTALRRERL